MESFQSLPKAMELQACVSMPGFLHSAGDLNLGSQAFPALPSLFKGSSCCRETCGAWWRKDLGTLDLKCVSVCCGCVQRTVHHYIMTLASTYHMPEVRPVLAVITRHVSEHWQRPRSEDENQYCREQDGGTWLEKIFGANLSEDIVQHSKYKGKYSCQSGWTFWPIWRDSHVNTYVSHHHYHLSCESTRFDFKSLGSFGQRQWFWSFRSSIALKYYEVWRLGNHAMVGIGLLTKAVCVGLALRSL